MNTMENMFGIYDLAISPSLDYNLDYIKNNNNVLTEFKNYYNCFDDEAIELIFNEIKTMSLKYAENNNNIWDSGFYKECLRIEKFFTVSREDEYVDSDNDEGENSKRIIKKKNKACNYCKESSKKTKRCSGCYIVRYCSYACQHRDWLICHKDNCLLISRESDNINNIDNLENEGEYEIKDIDADIDADINVDCEGEIKSNSLNDID